MDEGTAQKALRNEEGMEAHHAAATAFATGLMTQPNSITQELFEELREVFTDDQLIELTLDVMKWNYQKVSVALGTDREIRDGELSELHFDETGKWSFS